MTEEDIFLLTVIETALDLDAVAQIAAIAKIKQPSTKEASVRIAAAFKAARCRLATNVSRKKPEQLIMPPR